MLTLTPACSVLVASLRAQLDPAHATGKASAMLHFNLDRAVNRYAETHDITAA